MLLHPAQKIVAKDNHRFRVLRCGRRSGKTSLMIEEIKGIALSKPARIAYIARNYQQARDIAWDMLLKEMRGAIISTNDSRLELKIRNIQGSESLILLRGWESIENLRGQAFDFLCIDEVAFMKNFWSNWEEILRPTLTDRKGSVLFGSTPNGFNHFYDLCNKELVDSTYKTFHFTSWDNPFLPREEIEQAKATLPEEVFLQEYEASFQKKSGLVYKEFQRSLHLYEKLPKMELIKVAGIDFGFKNPCAVLHIYTNGDFFFVEDEWYKTERTDAQIAEYVSSCNFQAVYPDPESPGGIQELKNHRVNTREVWKGNGSIEAGIQKVRELFISGKLKINKRCINLISELEMYSYDEPSSDRNQKETPIDAYNHGLDALRYVVMTHQASPRVIHKQEELWEKNRRNLSQTTR